MPSQTDAQTIGVDGKPTPKRRFDARDWAYIAEFVIEEWSKRKRDRSTLEKHWKDIDRQIAMEPDIAYKMIADGNGGMKIDPKKAWMAEMELPLQAQALEVLTADARRMMFPDAGSWFRAHAEVTDEYLAKVDFSSLVKGDENEVPSRINQDNADKLVEGFLLHQFRQCDFETRLDIVNAESFKYGMGVGRARKETKNVFIHEARGVRRENQRIPVLVPVSIKNLFLDDPKPSMHSAQVLGPAHIAEDWIKLENLLVAANKGSSEPDNEDGGWMPTNASKLTADDNGYVQVLEMEGDIIVPRKTTRSMILPGAIVTVAVGGKSGDKVSHAVVRFRWRKMPFSSYVLFPYHYEGAGEAYPTSPLMKGRPIQIAATDALNRAMNSAALKQGPPVGYDRNDPYFAGTGGPAIQPEALWQTNDIQAIKVFSEVGGEPAAMMGIFMQLVSLYAELTGVLPARLGAQTISHTTAFAKDAELQRGAVRTVDYVRQSGKGPMTRWLDMAYRMGREELGSKNISFFIDAYGGYVEVDKSALPERANFEWFGAGGPAEEAAKMTMRLNSLQLGLKMDQLAAAYGKQPTIDLAAAVKEVLREGKWTDIDAITSLEVASPGPAAAPGMAGASEVGPGAAIAALQTLPGGGG